MCIAFNPNFRQVHHGGITTVLIDGSLPDPCHLQSRTPMVFVPYGCRLFGDVVPVVYDDGYFRQPVKIDKRYFHSIQCAKKTG